VRPFDEIVAEHGPVVLRVCRAMLAPADAEDAWSETFLSAMRAYPDLRPGSNVRGWLVTIAHRKAIDQIRKTNRAPRPTPTGEPAEPPSTVGGTSDGFDVADDRLAAAVAALPPKQRAAVVYRYLADLPYAEVGALLGSNQTAARRSAADGIANLRRTYQHGASL
jgi:RNA polymerase sigma factor (sigma-70 family)